MKDTTVEFILSPICPLFRGFTVEIMALYNYIADGNANFNMKDTQIAEYYNCVCMCVLALGEVYNCDSVP